MVKLTREQIEQKLIDKYLSAIISISMPYYGGVVRIHSKVKTLPIISGKIQKLAVEVTSGEPIVVFRINGIQYKADVNYFIENSTIHGNTHRASPGSERLPEGD